MNDVVLPEVGSRWTIGETNVFVVTTAKRGRGYQVHVVVEGFTDDQPTVLRLKDFNKKAVASV